MESSQVSSGTPPVCSSFFPAAVINVFGAVRCSSKQRHLPNGFHVVRWLERHIWIFMGARARFQRFDQFGSSSAVEALSVQQRQRIEQTATAAVRICFNNEMFSLHILACLVCSPVFSFLYPFLLQLFNVSIWSVPIRTPPSSLSFSSCWSLLHSRCCQWPLLTAIYLFFLLGLAFRTLPARTSTAVSASEQWKQKQQLTGKTVPSLCSLHHLPSLLLLLLL